MAIVQSRAPRHILFVSVSLAPVWGAALGLASAACSMRDGSDNRSEVVAIAKPTDSTRRPNAAPEPTSTPEPTVTPEPTATPGPIPRQSSGQTDTAGASPDSDRDPAITDVDPSSSRPSDPDVDSDVPRRPARSRKGRQIEIVLRSSPPGALATVDGTPIGSTPSLWEGPADASAHEFTFVLPGYAVARYRFVPTQSGIVHATLERIQFEPKDSDLAHRGGRKLSADSPSSRN